MSKKRKKRKSVYNYEQDRKWIENNRERKRYITYRSMATMFIRNHATLEDIEQLQDTIKKRLEALTAESEVDT